MLPHKDNTKSHSRIRSARGFSLVEALMAMALISLSVSAVGSFLDHQIRSTTSNHLSTQAYAIAADELESVRSMDYDTLANDTRDIVEGAVTFSVTTTVQNDTPAANMKQIEVHVGWNQPGGAQSVSLQTIYTALSTS